MNLDIYIHIYYISQLIEKAYINITQNIGETIFSVIKYQALRISLASRIRPTLQNPDSAFFFIRKNINAVFCAGATGNNGAMSSTLDKDREREKKEKEKEDKKKEKADKKKEKELEKEKKKELKRVERELKRNARKKKAKKSKKKKRHSSSDSSSSSSSSQESSSSSSSSSNSSEDDGDSDDPDARRLKVLNQIWPKDKRPEGIKSKKDLSKFSSGDIKNFFDMKATKEKAEKANNYEVLTKDVKPPKKRFKKGSDDCASRLHAARWERLPIIHPKKFWKKIPVARNNIFRCGLGW